VFSTLFVPGAPAEVRPPVGLGSENGNDPAYGATEPVGQDLAMVVRDARTEWAVHFSRTVAEEIRSGIRSGALTAGEAEELLARLRVIVDQALDMAPLA
jgi:hypothetical protein